ncbi:MAG: ligase-associated DNA damage response exonuclease, partial [Alphaproteobacteria bacterium]|nr:ligase-associated DNA damage response exonuclease [Alphaproteobacteria bacterium]
MTGPHPETWLRPTAEGLSCLPGGFVVDPVRPVPLAVVTHGHSDHARPGNGVVVATRETLAVMAARFGAAAAQEARALDYGDAVTIGDVRLRFAPAGHILGSAQAVIEHGGRRVVVSGDYKRRPDPTCRAFEPIACDVFVTEATFGLPVFRHPPDGAEIDKLLQAARIFPDRCILVGVYALGKAQRVAALLRAAGYDRPLHVHGALAPMFDLYRAHGVDPGRLLPVGGERARENAALKGAIVLAPPGAVADRWSRRLPDPLVAVASGWMRVKQRAKQGGVELPLVISDHADWDELTRTIAEVDAPEV